MAKQHEPNDITRAKVAGLAGLGASEGYLALEIGVGVESLRCDYTAELEFGVERANLAVAGALYRACVGNPDAVPPVAPNASACMFWLKTKAGWRDSGLDEKDVLEIVGRVIGAVRENVDDPVVLGRIRDRLKGVLG